MGRGAFSAVAAGRFRTLFGSMKDEDKLFKDCSPAVRRLAADGRWDRRLKKRREWKHENNIETPLRARLPVKPV